LTLSGVMPSSWLFAIATTAKASLILPQLDVLGLQPCAGERLLDGIRRRDGELHRVARRVAEVAEPGQDRASLALRPLFGHEHHRRRAVVDGAGVRRGDGPVLLERRFEARILSGRASFGPSSSVTAVLLPFLSTISTGAISALKAPSACAFCARRVDSIAYSSARRGRT